MDRPVFSNRGDSRLNAFEREVQDLRMKFKLTNLEFVSLLEFMKSACIMELMIEIEEDT